jgi:hypothetical protein
MSFDDYLAIDAVNWSTLKELRKSPKHYRHRLQVPRVDTAGLRRGRAAHTATFEPDRFLLDYVVFKGKTRRGKTWDAFKAAHPTESIIKPDEYRRALAIRDAVRGHPLAGPYLEDGEAEKAIQWVDDGSGLRCKARLDFVSRSKPSIVDLKTTGSISYPVFASTAYRLGYHCQAGFYGDGAKRSGLGDLPFVVIAVEAEPPHDVAVFEYLGDCTDAGLDEVRSLLVKLSYHRERNEWPGMYAEEQILEFPSWATPDANDDVAELGLEA